MTLFPQRRRWIVGSVVLMAGLAILGPYRWQRHNFRRFQEVRPGVLYRMGVPSELGFRQMVRQYGIRTVVCLHEQAPAQVKSGWFFDLGSPSGPTESQLADSLGVRFLHWPLSAQGAWPWPDPEHLEAFFRLMDQPENWPVLVHCWAGKHRAGTLAALFRLEYDRWPISAVLEEMYGFGFGDPYPLQEQNLRTYVRRARPSAQQWQALQAALAPWVRPMPEDYDQLVWALRSQRQKPEVQARCEEYLRSGQPFAVCLAARLIEGPDEPWLGSALRCAEQIVFSDVPGTDEELAEAVGLLADYASEELRTRLWETFHRQMREAEISPRYRALVAGLTNRYRTTRLPYLKLLLEDRRSRPEPEAAGAYYADTAVARLAAIVQVDFLGRRGMADRQDWDQAIERAKQWFAEHPEAARVSPSAPPP